MPGWEKFWHFMRKNLNTSKHKFCVLAKTHNLFRWCGLLCGFFWLRNLVFRAWGPENGRDHEHKDNSCREISADTEHKIEYFHPCGLQNAIVSPPKMLELWPLSSVSHSSVLFAYGYWKGIQWIQTMMGLLVINLDKSESSESIESINREPVNTSKGWPLI